MAPTVSSGDAANSTIVVGWVPDPNGRGTSSLFVSCILTLGLCVWSALHLNIPMKSETRRQYWIRRVKWAVCGILIPELVVLLAWRQWTSARRLTSEINKAFDDSECRVTSSKSSSRTRLRGIDDSKVEPHLSFPQRRYPWTNVHSFYAGAGGFVFELKASAGGYGVPPFISGPERLTVTAHGVLLLAQSGLLPDLDVREIKDKAKTDGLAKALVLLQASWMLLQTFGRVATHIPTSLLEVNTIGHILCTFIIYLLWWNKPREVHEPTVLTGPWVDSLCAYMYMSSRVSGTKIKGRFKPRSWIIPEMKRCVYLDYDRVFTSCSRRSSADENVDSIEMGTVSSPKRRPTVRVDSVQSENSGMFQFQPSFYLESQKTVDRKLKLGWTLEPNDDNSTLRKARYELAAAAVQEYPAVRARLTRATDTNSNEFDPAILSYEPVIEQMVVHHARNWPSDFLLPGLGGALMGMALWFATMVYGGVHIAAWHEYFPTRVEQRLWHISSVYITSSGLLWFLMNVMGAISPWASDYWDRFTRLQAFWIEYIVYGTVATACGLFYIFARAFLVIDAIVSLRQLPIQTYNTPQWSDLIPHL